MPAPVEFTIISASLPPGWSGDPQDMLTKFAESLIITPSEPWSSFINGGAQPASNVGPFLFNGVEWRVWSDGLGTYTFATQNGAGIVNATVTLAKLANDTPNSVLTYNSSGRPTLLSATSPGDVVTADSGLAPVFAPPATGNFFDLHVGTAQNYVSDGSNVQVHFDTTTLASGVTPDLSGFRIPVTASSVWYFGASLQIAQINGTHTDVQHFLAIRPYQNATLAIGATDGYTPAQLRNGVQCSGIYQFGGAGYVDVVIASTADTSALNFQIETNGTNTRFWGFRLK